MSKLNLNPYIISVIVILIIVFCIIQLLINNKYFYNTISKLLNRIPYIPYDEFKIEYPIKKSAVPIYVFYHICTKNMDIVYEQVSQIVSSGLYAKATRLYYGCNCSGCDTTLQNYMKTYSKFQPMNDAILPDKKSYENETINSMIKMARESEQEFHALYIHTKGTSAVSSNQGNWRKDMMYWLVDKYQVCSDILDRGFNTVGIFYTYHYSFRHYSGNFFWANSNYIAKLEYITDYTNRYNAEMILFSKYQPKTHVSLLNINYLTETMYYVRPDIDKNAPLELSII